MGENYLNYQDIRKTIKSIESLKTKLTIFEVLTLVFIINAAEKNNDYNLTLEKCHNTVGVAILNTSITIVFGFSILVLSNFIPTIYFGVFTGIAMLLAMLSVLTLLPKLILTFKPFGNV